MRDGQVIIPRASTVLQVNDKVVLFSEAKSIKAIEKLFAVRLEFF